MQRYTKTKIKAQCDCSDECNSNKIECYNMACIAIKTKILIFFWVDTYFIKLNNDSSSHSETNRYKFVCRFRQ